MSIFENVKYHNFVFPLCQSGMYDHSLHNGTTWSLLSFVTGSPTKEYFVTQTSLVIWAVVLYGKLTSLGKDDCVFS